MAIEQTTRTQIACKIVDLRRIGPSKNRVASSNTPHKAEDHDIQTELQKIASWGNQKKREIDLQARLSAYLREFEILCSFSHPNIIELDKVYIANSSLYIFQDLATAGNLHTYLDTNNKSITEVEAATLIWQVLKAVQFLHERHIAHRDLRPENIMVTGLPACVKFVLTSFGNARKIAAVRKSYVSTGISSTTEERIGSGTMFAADMWRVGIIAALLLLGSLTEHNIYINSNEMRLDPATVLTKIKQLARRKHLSETAQDFIQDLLVSEDNDRMSATEALKHFWFSNTQNETNFEKLYHSVTSNWRPRLSDEPVIEFMPGRSTAIRQLKCFAQFIENREARQAQIKRSRNVPVEPPYMPFPRRMHEQSGLWPKRSRTRSMSVEAEEAIARNWSPDLSHKSEKQNPSTETRPPLSKEWAQLAIRRSALSKDAPAVPILRRSDSSSGTSHVLGTTLSHAFSTPNWLVTTSRMPAVEDYSGISHIATDFRAEDSAKRILLQHQDSLETTHIRCTDGVYQRRHAPDSNMLTPPIDQVLRQSKMFGNQTVDSIASTRAVERKPPVALNVRSRSKLQSRPRSNSISSLETSIPSPAARTFEESVYDHEFGSDTSDASGDGGSRAQRSKVFSSQRRKLKPSLSEDFPSVWVHEEWLRLTEEDMNN